jgi:hypothetical protein
MALTLAAGISASDRYCTVNQPPTQPPGSYYRIGDEVVQHIGYVTTTPIWTPNFTQLYIARAQLGTTAASHLSAAALTYVRPEFLSAIAETDPGPFETGGAGGGGGPSGLLADPGNVWQPSTAVVEGYRIAETVATGLGVFEVSVAGTTDGAFETLADYGPDLTPLGMTTTGTETWVYLGVVGQIGYDVMPTTLSGSINATDAIIRPTSSSVRPLNVRGASGQTAGLLRVQAGNGSTALQISSDSGDIGAIDIDAGANDITMQGGTIDAASDRVLIGNNGGLARFDASKVIVQQATAAPADSDLIAGAFAFWFDQTNGAAKLMIKAKQADGTVRTGSVSLT